MRSVFVALSVLLFTFSATNAQSPSTSSGGFEKKNYNYSEWTKGLLSEVVTVTHPGKMIFLAGVGAEDESGQRGVIRSLGDFAGQCRYAYDKIKRLLAAQGATMNDVVKIVTYVTESEICPKRASAAARHSMARLSRSIPSSTSINWPGQACWWKWM